MNILIEYAIPLLYAIIVTSGLYILVGLLSFHLFAPIGIIAISSVLVFWFIPDAQLSSIKLVIFATIICGLLAIIFYLLTHNLGMNEMLLVSFCLNYLALIIGKSEIPSMLSIKNSFNGIIRIDRLNSSILIVIILLSLLIINCFVVMQLSKRSFRPKIDLISYRTEFAESLGINTKIWKLMAVIYCHILISLAYLITVSHNGVISFQSINFDMLVLPYAFALAGTRIGHTYAIIAAGTSTIVIIFISSYMIIPGDFRLIATAIVTLGIIFWPKVSS